MNVQELLANPPKLHGPEHARFDSYRLEDELFMFLDQQIKPGMRTLEIGAGSSTIIFAIKGARHTCIVPDPVQIDRIRDFCASHGVALDSVQFIAQPSQQALPAIEERGFDCVLIDGNHGFPSVFVDWYYCARLLRLGGIGIVDDLHIWTCNTLVDLLRGEPEWRLVKETSRAAIFAKLAEGSQDKEWTTQAYVVRRSRGTALLPKLLYLLQLVRRGNLGLLLHNILLRFKRA